MKYSKIFEKGLFCLLGSFILLVFSTGMATPVIASEIEIKIGASFDITGLYADVGMVRAYQDYIKWVNDHGGLEDLNGKKCILKLVWQDAQSNVAKGMAAYKDFKSKGCVVMYFSSTGQNYALKARAKKDKIPFVSQLVTNVVFEGKDSWVHTGTGFRQNAVGIIDGVKKIWKEKRPPIIGFMGWDNLIGQDPFPYGIAYAKEMGFKVGPVVWFSPKALDVTPQLRELHNGKCDYVCLAIAGGQEAMVIKNKYHLGFQDMKFLSFGASATAGWATIKKMEPKVVNGDYNYSPFCLESDDTPGVKRIIEIQKRYHNGEVMIDHWGDYTFGHLTAYVTVSAIERAIKKVPADKLTGADLKKYGLEGLNVDPLGISLSLSYADYEGDKQSTGGGRLCLKKDRKMIPVTP
ncbi:MAG: ABC transporter substrate-binding protein, partial [Thermodesulfobacteriota bacterium]|nr:ABC transporter substrate-binding protein [Thermodesulfobacteriota bacterium]